MTPFLRKAILWILTLGLVGVGAELILLEHTEDLWQWLPLVLVGGALVVEGWVVLAPQRLGVLTLRTVMMAFLVAGGLGLMLHYKGNAEFELEMYPSLGGWDLFREALSGATPTLAPGTMIQLGLLGLLYTFRHPALGGDSET